MHYPDKNCLGMTEGGITINPERIAKGLYWDRAWSLVSGCSYVSKGCANCWAAREAHMRGQQRNIFISARYAGLTTEEGRWNGRIRMLHEYMDLPLRTKKPTVWAVWNDLFHPDVPDEFIFKAFSTMANSQCFYGHTFLVLTKRPERMRSIIQAIEADIKQQRIPETLPNGNTRHNLTFTFPLQRIWLGVTAENQRAADERIPVLLQIPAAVRFVSAEPMLGPVDLRHLTYDHNFLIDGLTGQQDAECGPPHDWGNGLDWVICGGESGPGSRPMHPDWVRDLRDQCQAASVPYFFKQHGEWEAFYDRDIDDPDWRNVPEEKPNICRLNLAGGQGFHGDRVVYFRRAGKKKAGRLLDGREWSEIPRAAR